MALTPQQPRTYLQLCQDLYREVGASGGNPTQVLPSVAGAQGELLRLVNYVHDAELDIQNLWVDWKWLNASFYCYTGINGDHNGIYTQPGGLGNLSNTSAFPTDLAEWDYPSFKIWPAGSTNLTGPPQTLPTVERQEVREFVFDNLDFDIPSRVIIENDNTFKFDLAPDQSYQLLLGYRKVPYDLKVDADISNIPARFANRLIVEWARLKYGLFENAAEQVQMAKSQIYGIVNDSGIMTMQGLLAQLENDQLPNAKNSRLQQGNDIIIGGGQSSFDDWGSGYYGFRPW